MTRRELFDTHLFDEDAPEEQVPCGTETTRTERRGIRGYLEDRLRGNEVGSVCQECKALSMPLAKDIIEELIQDLEDEGRLGDAEDYRQLTYRLTQELGQDRKQD